MRRAEDWYKAFPELTLIMGNHDRIPARQLRKLGMEPAIYMRPIEELMGMPEGWKVEEQIEIDGVLYHHGETATGVNHLAFAYGKHFKNKPIIGCGVVIDGVPYAEPMDLGSKIRRV